MIPPPSFSRRPSSLLSFGTEFSWCYVAPFLSTLSFFISTNFNTQNYERKALKMCVLPRQLSTHFSESICFSKKSKGTRQRRNTQRLKLDADARDVSRIQPACRFPLPRKCFSSHGGVHKKFRRLPLFSCRRAPLPCGITLPLAAPFPAALCVQQWPREEYSSCVS